MLNNLRNRYINPWTLVMRDVDELFGKSPAIAQWSWDNQEGSGRLVYDIDESDEHYTLSFDIPGVKRDELQIELVGNQLRVSGERKSDSGKMSRRFGKFEHAFTLPEGISSEGVQAEYQDGVLSILIPKPTAAKPVKIAIKERGDSAKQGGLLKGIFGEKNQANSGACCN